MKTLINKEIRLLLPMWIVAMLLAVAPLWVCQLVFSTGLDATDFPPPLFIMLGMLLLGIASFGQEFNLKTFPMLLGQPIPRSRIWWIKISLLGIAFLSILAGSIISWLLFPLHHSWFAGGFGGTELWIFVLAFSSGGLWATLLLRQAIGAFWVALFTPFAISMLLGILLSPFPVSPETADAIILAAFIVYSIGGFFWARRLFFNAQDTDWTGGHVFFPWRKKTDEHITSSLAVPFQDRNLSLIWKEIKLHEVNLFIAIIVLAINLISLPARHLVSNRNTQMIIEFAWALWLLMPLLIGCAAVSEERRLGVLESQLCLPVSRRVQFFIKFFAALVLSVLLGAFLPTLIERSRNFGVTDWAPYWIFYAAPAIFLVSFYASTLARSAIQTIGLALAIPAVIGLVIPVFLKTIFWPEGVFHSGYETTGRAILTLSLGLPILVLVLVIESLRNFKWLQSDWRVWRHNFITVFAALISILALTSSIYPRPWESFMRLDGRFGPSRFDPSSAPRLLVQDGATAALLPDGRLWIQQQNINYDHNWRITPVLNSQRYVGGSNWVDVAMDMDRIVTIQSDGTLWTVTKPGVNDYYAYPLTRIGSETDWLHTVSFSGAGFLLIKKDGTLWLWGRANGLSWSETENKSDLAIPPVPINGGENFAEFLRPLSDSDSFVRKKDGSIWFPSWVPAKGSKGGSWELFPTHGLEFVSCAMGDSDWTVGVTTNGDLWLERSGPSFVKQLLTQRIQFGQNAKWKAVACPRDNSIVALRNDGTLWEWPSFWNRTQQNPASTKPRQLGTYSDWIALHSFHWAGCPIALAADGSLWCWKDGTDHIWLAPSRKPLYMGNIFETSSSP